MFVDTGLDFWHPAGSTIRRAAGVFGWTTPQRVAEAVVQAVEYDARQTAAYKLDPSGRHK